MKTFTRTLFITKESLNLIQNDINAVNEYKVFSNKEEGTIEVEVSLSVAEEFKITEDILMDIIQGLTPALEEKKHEELFQKTISHLRSIGASI